MDIEFYKENSYRISKLVTRKYSTSFSFATSLLEKEKQRAIYGIYGFVRLADEVVDTFHDYDKAYLLRKLQEDLDYALENGISTNMILVAFADTVKKYHIDREHIRAFMKSMEYDLTKSEYNNIQDFDNYVYGSADVVGLMCLQVFCNGDKEMCSRLEASARKLGSAFQKVNFLRDLKDDIHQLGRSYFPEISNYTFNRHTKQMIEASIGKDFDDACVGMKQLPGRSKLAVALAFYYYKSLFLKIQRTSPEQVLKKRIRISNIYKYVTIIKVAFLYKINCI